MNLDFPISFFVCGPALEQMIQKRTKNISLKSESCYQVSHIVFLLAAGLYSARLVFPGVSDDHKSYQQWDELPVIEAYQTPLYMCSNFNYGSSGIIDLPVSVLLSHEYDFFHLPAPLLNFLQCFPIHDAMNICISDNGIASAQVPVLSWRFRSGFGP